MYNSFYIFSGYTYMACIVGYIYTAYNDSLKTKFAKYLLLKSVH